MHRGNVDVIKEGKSCKIKVLGRTQPSDRKRLVIVIDDTKARDGEICLFLIGCARESGTPKRLTLL
jgi:hypothetical protein